MKQLVIMPGGFHPFHAGHLALYQSALQAFPGADVKVAATNDTSNRPFPFKLKEKLAQLAGVPPGDFYQVKSPFRAEEITRNYDPADTQLIFVRSEKDADQPPRPGGIKKDGNPAYLQPISRNMAPMTQHAYMAYLPTVTFGPGIRSATEIRTAWPELDERRRMALVMSLYPHTQKNPKLAKTVVKMLDTAMGAELTEVLNTKAGKSNHAHWNTSDPDMVKFNFTASNGVEYQLDFLAPYIGPENMSPYDYFDSDEVFDNSKFVSFEQLTNDIKGGHPVAKQGIEGTGSAAEVFGIVVHAIIQYVKKARPALLYFQAAEPNRRALYARMIQRVLPSLPGWASMTVGNGEFGIYNKRAIKSAMGAEVTEGELDRFKKYVRPIVKTTPKIEKTTNPSGRTTDHVEWKVTGNTGEIRRFKSKKEAQAYFDSFGQQGVAEGGAETSWSRGTDKITLQDILELTKDIKQINLAINDNLKSKLLHWDGNPEEIERVNQVTVSKQFPILIMVDEQGQIEWILDGNHRLHKAIQSQAKTIPAKLIRPSNLNDKAKKIFNIKDQSMAEEVTRQMSQGGLRASYQDKYNQPMMEDYLDEARS